MRRGSVITLGEGSGNSPDIILRKGQLQNNESDVALTWTPVNVHAERLAKYNMVKDSAGTKDVYRMDTMDEVRVAVKHRGSWQGCVALCAMRHKVDRY